MVIKDIISDASAKLCGVSENPVREARLLLSHATGLSMTDIIIKENSEIAEKSAEKFQSFISMRQQSMPVAYIIGEKEFYGLPFRVREGVLIPRPDTEILVELGIKKAKKSILDICTGSGCIAIATAKNRPDISVCGIDISDTALAVAEENNRLLCTDVQFRKLDILNDIPDERYDTILSNPPYITREEMQNLMPDVKNFEPDLALFGGDDGLIFYRRICEIAPHILTPGGLLAFELGFCQYEPVKKIMEENFKDIDFLCDLSGIKRVIYGYLAK